MAVADDVAMVEFPGGLGGERLGVGMEEQDADAMEQGFVKIERGMRMDTEGTLVGHDDDEGEVKELQD